MNGAVALSAGAVYVDAEAAGAEVVEAGTDGVGAVGTKDIGADTAGAGIDGASTTGVGMVVSGSKWRVQVPRAERNNLPWFKGILWGGME